MSRLLLAAAIGLIVAASVQADIGPPKGKKRVALDHKITTEKEFPDYVFYTVLGGGGKTGGKKDSVAGAEGVTLVKFDPKTPIEIKAAGRGGGIGRQGSLCAVPKDAAKKYDNEKEFLAAIRSGKVEGQVRAKANFGTTIDIAESDPRTSIEMEYKVEKVDKDGIVGKFVTDDKKEPEKKDPGKKDGPEDDEDSPVASAPKGGMWIAGVAATLGLVLSGFWLAGRNRRA
jgi:hypothetical protein